jgi:hypothetical protein
MKTQIRSLLTLVCAASANLLIIGSPAQAGYIVTLQQVGSNVVASGNGAVDLTGLTFGSTGTTGISPFVYPVAGAIVTGSAGAPVTFYTGSTSGPTNFGSGSQTFADSTIGDFVAFQVNEFIGGISGLAVPQGYVSNSLLSDSAIYNNATLSSLGVTPGTYVWSWGTGGDQKFTLQIGAAAVPDSGSTFGLSLVALSGLFGVSRFRSSHLA